MMNFGPHTTPNPDPAAQWLQALRTSLEDHSFTKLVLSKHRGSVPDLERVEARQITLKGQTQVSFVSHHTTRDVTHNLGIPEALACVARWMAHDFGAAHLWAATLGELQWLQSKKGRQTLLHHRCQTADATAAPAPTHDRAKRRWVDQNRAFLQHLGVTDAQHAVVPAMARKWKQINKFVEIFDGALRSAGLLGRAAEQPIRVADFGSGKGYLTFSVHDHVQHRLGLAAQVVGVELREELVAFCNGAVGVLGLQGLAFDAGDVRSYGQQTLDVVIALHACDVATDYAIDWGVRSGAQVIVCSPCCHREIRPQLRSPQALRPILRHGVHLGQEAEMVTDGLRALLLEAAGYSTQVFEFVSLEHTAKNKMILAVKRDQAAPSAPWLDQVAQVKAFYGIQTQCLEGLLFGKTAAATGML
jgi:hypothetical protein